MYSAVVPKGAFSIRYQPQPPKTSGLQLSTLGSNWRCAQARWLNTNRQAHASGRAPILSMLLHSDVSPGVHPFRDLPSCYQPLLDKMSLPAVFIGVVLKLSGSISVVVGSCCDDFDYTPSDICFSSGVHPLRDLYPLVTNPFSTRWPPPVVFIDAVILMISGSLSALTQSAVPVAIGAILMVSSVWQWLFSNSTLWFEVPPTPAFLGVGPIGFWLPLARYPVPEVFVAGLCSCLSSMFSPLP